MVTPANTTVLGIQGQIRRELGISSGIILPDSVIDEAINYVYNQMIPQSVKLDQLKDIFTFYTLPYVDTYQVDINKYQSFRNPVKIDGVPGFLFESRNAWESAWPTPRTYLTPASGDGDTQLFTFSVGGLPILQRTFMGSTQDSTGNSMVFYDSPNGNSATGNLLLVQTDNLGNLIPEIPPNTPLPPTPLPDPPYNNVIGQINYLTGNVILNFPVAPGAGTPILVNFFCYQPGRPTAVFYLSNYIKVRPIPKQSHKIEIEVYKNPAEFVTTSESPFLHSWKDYIVYAVSYRLVGQFGDNELEKVMREKFEIEEGRVAERQANQEIGRANATIFNQSPFMGQYNMYPYGGYWQ